MRAIALGAGGHVVGTRGENSGSRLFAERDAMVRAANAAMKPQGLVVSDDNQADAFFLAVIARNFGQEVMPNVRAQLEVLHQLKHPTPRKISRVRRRVKNAI